MKQIYNETKPEDFKLFQYRNQAKTNKFTNKFKDFVIHCLKQMIGIDQFDKVSKKRTQVEGVRELLFEYSYEFDTKLKICLRNPLKLLNGMLNKNN